MKTALILTDEVAQINLTPETPGEKAILALLADRGKNISIAVKRGSFGNKPEPYHTRVQSCQGGFLRAFDGGDSVMLVLTQATPEETKSDE